MLVRMGTVSPVFAGRAAELGELRGAHARACAGGPAAVLVAGRRAAARPARSPSSRGGCAR